MVLGLDDREYYLWAVKKLLVHEEVIYGLVIHGPGKKDDSWINKWYMYNVSSSWLGVKFMEKYAQILAMILIENWYGLFLEYMHGLLI